MLTLQLIACIGMIMGCFFVWNIRLEDFTADLFRGILGKPRNIQDAILEETNSKKMPLLKREILEVQEILSVTGREKQFPLLCTAALLFFTLGASAAILMGNFFLVPVLATGCLFLPFWYIKLTAHSFKKTKAQKIPPKIRKYSFAMLMCFMITYIIIIGYEILKSMSGMM